MVMFSISLISSDIVQHGSIKICRICVNLRLESVLERIVDL